MINQEIATINIPEAKVFVEIELSEKGEVIISTGRLFPFKEIKSELDFSEDKEVSQHQENALFAIEGRADIIRVDNSTGKLIK